MCVQSAVKKPDLLTLTKSACWRWNRVRKRRAPSSVIVVMVKVQTLGAVEHSPLYTSVDPLQSMSREEKLDILRRVDKVAREADKRVQEVTASLSGVYELILVAATDGTLAADVRPLVRLSVSVLVEEDGKRERGASGGGGRFGYEFFLADLDGEVRADAWAKEAVRMALVNLSAVAAPAGTMPVVLGAGWPGVLLHEAVGHGLEGDFNRRGTSVFSGQVGELVASELCTVVDDGTMVDRRGSVAIDDEGTPGQYNVLIENGILKGYMQDKLNARLMGMTPTGNGRRESYAHLPMPRMTNTYMLPGKSTPQEIIESVEYGIYAPNFGGGQVDITSGKFVFSTSEAYLIENGKVTKPVKGATLIGSGIETMQQISMVGNDLKLDNGVGVCGKEGQSLPVGVGQPTLKVDNLTVGGTA
ncbi:TldD protein [Escherichia coli]|nr:TldD protein [Escherichia coli]